jgi:hypothetical protein
MPPRLNTLTLSAAVLAASIACSGSPAGPGDVPGVQPSERVGALIAALAQQGVTAVPKEQMPRESHCLSVGALRLAANEENLYVFEYESVAAADRDAAAISPDGDTISGADRACSILWIGPPRFYKSDRLIVLYVGTNQPLIRTLDGLLGRPFASR